MNSVIAISVIASFTSSAAIAQAVPEEPASAVDRSTLTHSAVVAAPIAEVWSAFTTEEGVESWMVAQAEIDFRVGGAMRTHYDPNGTIGDAGTIENTYLAIVPERLLAFRCTKAPEGVWFKDLIGETWSVALFEETSQSATRLTLVGVGYTDDPDSQRMRDFFEAGNQQVLDALVAKFDSASQSSQDNRILELLKGLAGEWLVEDERPDGSIFRVKNVYEIGPDGRSIVSRSWLGSADEMHPHHATQVWREPGVGGIAFQSIDENGAIARGPITLEGDNTLIWAWNMTAQDGSEAHYLVRQTIESESSYRFNLFQNSESGELNELVNVVFERARE